MNETLEKAKEKIYKTIENLEDVIIEESENEMCFELGLATKKGAKRRVNFKMILNQLNYRIYEEREKILNLNKYFVNN